MKNIERLEVEEPKFVKESIEKCIAANAFTNLRQLNIQLLIPAQINLDNLPRLERLEMTIHNSHDKLEDVIITGTSAQRAEKMEKVIVHTRRVTKVQKLEDIFNWV